MSPFPTHISESVIFSYSRIPSVMTSCCWKRFRAWACPNMQMSRITAERRGSREQEVIVVDTDSTLILQNREQRAPVATGTQRNGAADGESWIRSSGGEVEADNKPPEKTDDNGDKLEALTTPTWVWSGKQTWCLTHPPSTHFTVFCF